MRYRVLLTAALAIVIGSRALASSYHAVVEQQATANTDAGVNVYDTIAAALQAAPNDGKEPHIIFIRAGHYREKLTVDKPNITLIGESTDATRLTFDAYAGQPMPGSQETWGTFRSATVTVNAADFRAENLTIENSFDFLANDARSGDDPQKVRGTQAVALAIDGDSDRTALRNVRLSGYQDTLYVNAGRSYILDSVIEGNVDFIFGAGRALFEHSVIVSRPRGKTVMPSGYITAPSTDIGNDYGLVFLKCRLLKEDGVPQNSVPLGRPWHPTTDFADGRYADPAAIGASVFIDTYMDDHIASDGWASMRGTSRDGSKSTVFEPESARFFEYRSRGPGTARNSKRRQLNRRQAQQYTRTSILGDWKPVFFHEIAGKPLGPGNE
ncbi:pectinesterase [Microbulbifer donghaiensis]|uniref:Pectinesterase n=1 Tax=Microbulbifer donghaiensis TaxID=494016 RepID=A0A1M5DX68_9GAMM|nr:pectinesterase family protein [Microbulbifer donghaiensis]SHF71549.1 pectinesterase [Microbulbifer donghaiensis]